MSAVAATQGPSASLLAAVNGTKATAGTNLVEDTQSRFLKLLMTQMKNQDPLNPLDNAQVTSQLAQLSTVDGINKLNTSMQALSGMFAESRSLQAASLVGKAIVAPGSQLQLGDSGGVGAAELAQPVDSLLVTVKDAAGNVLQKIDLGPQQAGVINFQWDGVRSDGGAAAAGTYQFSLEATQGGKKAAVNPLAFATVISASLGGQGTVLGTDSMGAVDLAKVKQVY